MAKEIDQRQGKSCCVKRHDRKLLILTIYRLVRKNRTFSKRFVIAVVIVAETGSGKTTQLPKICMELGRGIKGLIGHTQPRRPAARTVANRIAEELKTERAVASVTKCVSAIT